MSNKDRSAGVLFIDHTARMGGGEIALLNLVRELDPARYRPTVMLFADGPLRERMSDVGVDVCVIPLAAGVGDVRKDSLGAGSLLRLGVIWRSIFFVWRVGREIRRLRPAIVHTNSLKSDLIGGVAARLARVPVIWHVRDRIADDYLPRPAVVAFRWLAGWLPTMVIANSRATLATLKPHTRGMAIPSGTDPVSDSVIHDGIAAAPTTDRVGANSGHVVGLVGRLARWKGQHVFIEAARLVRNQFPDAKFQIIGSALFGEEAYERDLRAQVTRDGLESVVDFMGFRTDVHEAIAGLDILVHASITGEPFGQVIVEGMTAAKPVVATRGGGVPEIVEDGRTGILVPMDDAPAMARAIERLLGDPDLRAKMGRLGRQRVVEHFTIRRTAERVQAVYDKLLAEHARKT